MSNSSFQALIIVKVNLY